MSVTRTRLVTERYDLGSLRLYREDLVSITTATAEAGDLKIVAGNFEATSPADFDAMPEHMDSVTIEVRRGAAPGGIRVVLSRRAALVELVEPDTQAAGILSHIRLICEPRRTHLRSRVPPEGRGRGFPYIPMAVTLAFAGLGAIALAASVSSPGHPARWSAADSVLSAVVGAILLAAVTYGMLTSRPRVVIINAPRADRPTYWQRTRDTWWIGIATALLGAAVGYALGKLT